MPSMIFTSPPEDLTTLQADIAASYRADETQVVKRLLDAAHFSIEQLDNIAARARALVVEVRKRRIGKGGLDAFLHEYELSSQEGVVLMCLAEALLRIPDAETADRLIRDKLGPADWEGHLGQSDSLFVNASTWALMLTGRVVGLHEFRDKSLKAVLSRLVNRVGEPMIRQSVTQGMRILGRQFVIGRTIEEALHRAREDTGYRHSFDMLGEAARTAADAERYFRAYEQAIDAIGASPRGHIDGPGISVKLSALHPRYELSQRHRVIEEILPRLVHLAALARAKEVGLTVDAEEADRLDLSLELVEAASGCTELRGWDGFGLAVQAYQKRALPVIHWLADLARRDKRRFMVRLVKGAYWDTEIKLAQERGLDGYPVFTRKAATDVSFLACAKQLLASPACFYPQFATHNAHTLSAIMELAGDTREFEFQRLHGMGEALYEQVVGADFLNVACRIYAPVGSHEDLLAYLVRRLLENGANTSFVNRIVDERAPIEEIIDDPTLRVRRLSQIPHPSIPLPGDIYQPERRNSIGLPLTDPAALKPISLDMQRSQGPWSAAPLIGGVGQEGKMRPVRDPADTRRLIGNVTDASPEHIDRALRRAGRAFPDWDESGGDQRASCLDRLADLMERDTALLMALAVREAGKTILDGVAEIREAVDFCRYYAACCRRDFERPIELPGPTGEHNLISLHGRGPFVCISPWNFPLAIFTGQIAAALAAGNSVISKPAEQTSLMAAYAIGLFHEAGVPPDVLQLLPGDGASVGGPLIGDPRIAGVAFTGSTETARLIHRSLAAKDGPIVPLIAETGGQNAMIVDSSALPEQVTADVMASSFQSAGQRCSALRVLYVQSDIADKLMTMLTGAMAELSIGDPAFLSTDVGPVIDTEALAVLESHVATMKREAVLLYQSELPPPCQYGTFIAPAAFEIANIGVLEREVFGPILHIVRYDSDDLDDVIDDINETGYGLTLGIHSRINETVNHIHARARVGNTYVNRNQIGAVVGVQPFGGEGLSGTGPKAGGPRYLHRFATERSLSINTTAQGGNASLMSLQEDA